MPQPASKRLVTEADINDPTSAAGAALAASIAAATAPLIARLEALEGAAYPSATTYPSATLYPIGA